MLLEAPVFRVDGQGRFTVFLLPETHRPIRGHPFSSLHTVEISRKTRKWGIVDRDDGEGQASFQPGHFPLESNRSDGWVAPPISGEKAGDCCRARAGFELSLCFWAEKWYNTDIVYFLSRRCAYSSVPAIWQAQTAGGLR